MRYSSSLMLCLTLLCPILASSGYGYQSETKSPSSTQLTSDSMSERIDAIIDAKLKSLGWNAAEECSDASFIRRAYLDLTGTPPKAAEVQQFVDDKSPKKRFEILKRLVSSPTHAEHLAAIWSAWLTPERDDMPILGPQQNGLQTWLRSRFMENLRYDRLVADLLVASGSTESGPTSFFLALENKPEKIATQTARIFMGVQLDCAQCHDHPFDQWKQKDFWGFAAYFAQISNNTEAPMRNAEVIDSDKGEVMLPNSEEVVAPKPLVQTNLVSARGTRRQQLTLWLTTRDNPFLARATVNRVWAMLMGRGLVEPVDDMRVEHLASHPELLDELSAYFTATGYDLRKLILAITQTRVYSRSSRHPSGNTPEDAYAVMLTKPLTERQLASSISEVARQLGSQTQATQQQLIRQIGKLRGEASQSKLGIVSALVTLHGDLVDQASNEKSSRLLKALQAPHLDQRGQVRWMFLTTLNRTPTQQEEQRIYAMIAQASTRTASSGSTDSSSATPTTTSPATASSEATPATPSSATTTSATTPATTSPAANTSATNSGSSTDSANKAELQWQSDLLWALLNSSEFAMTP